MLSNEYYPQIALIVNRSLDIPFAIISILYAFANLKKITDPEETDKISTYLFVLIGAMILAGIIYINFVIPDRPIEL